MGGGIAGAAAARTLCDAGISVRVLEARDRTGGRICSLATRDMHVELGAHWIHEPFGAASALMSLFRKAGLRCAASLYDWVTVFESGGARHPPHRVQAFFEEMDASILPAYRQLCRPGNRASMMDVTRLAAQRIADRSAIANYLDLYIQDHEHELGCPLEQASADWYLGAPEQGYRSAENLLVTNGYGRVVDYLLRGISVQLDTAVHTIRRRADRVVVDTSRGRFEAEAVIVTIPIKLLQTGVIQFIPELPRWKENAFQKVGIGLSNKVFLAFEEPFWDDEWAFAGFSRMNGEASKSIVVNLHQHQGAPVLAMLATGSAAAWLEQTSEYILRKEYTNLLSRAYPDADIEPVALFKTGWQADKWAQGSYSYIPIGTTLADLEELAAPVGQVYFAGEAMAFENHATVHGAYLSGVQTAKQLLATWLG